MRRLRLLERRGGLHPRYALPLCRVSKETDAGSGKPPPALHAVSHHAGRQNDKRTMAKDYNNVKCEGCIHLGQFGNCWQGETPAECNNKMTIEQAVARLDDNIHSAERAGRLYADEMTSHTHTARRAAMFDGNDLREAFEAGAAWAAQFGANAGK